MARDGASGGAARGRRGGTAAAVLAVCAGAGVPVVPQGGNTGLVGGGVPPGRPAVVVSTRRLPRLDPGGR